MPRVILALLLAQTACQNPDGTTDWTRTRGVTVGVATIAGAALALSGDSDEDVGDDEEVDRRSTRACARERARVLRADCDKRYGINARNRDWNRCLEGERHYSQVVREGCAEFHRGAGEGRRCEHRLG